MKSIEGGVVAPVGFRASGVNAGIKPGSTKKDCALIVSREEDTSVAGTFTTNVMKSPPVFWNIDVCARGKARAVFINSGNANAATGSRGAADVKAMAAFVANGAPYGPEEVCICSTGVIGVPLPMKEIEDGIDDCIDGLGEGSSDAAEAIMTTDTVKKERALEVEIGGKVVRLGGIAKGSGMISPNMATMIAIVTTDAHVAPEVLQPLVSKVVGESFNQIGIDNDMSTSDTVLVFANGASETEPLTPDEDGYEIFAGALLAICQDLARDLVKDGEGATKFVEIAVKGTKSDEDARTIARAIGNSQLCKTAFFGEDPNWGRFACAAGYSGVEFDPGEISVALNDVVLCENGLVAEYLEEDAAAVMRQPEFAIHVSVGSGSGCAVFWTSDLSHDYVSINADYRT